MSTKEANSQSPIEPQLVSASTMTTPDTANLVTPNEFRGDTATPGKDKPKTETEGAKPKTKMAPPPLPINIVQPTPYVFCIIFKLIPDVTDVIDHE
jgi:hypothetical protein